MDQTSLLPDMPESWEGRSVEPTSPQDARVVRPVRNQVQFLMQDLDATLPEDHQARVIWDFLDRLDLSAFYGSIQAVQGGPGRPASDPQVLLVRLRRMGVRHGGGGRQRPEAGVRLRRMPGTRRLPLAVRGCVGGLPSAVGLPGGTSGGPG